MCSPNKYVLARLLLHPFRVRNVFWVRHPGCAARPWALEFNRFAVG